MGGPVSPPPPLVIRGQGFQGIENARRIGQGSPGVQGYRRAEGFGNLFLRNTQLHGRFGVARDASVAACCDRDRKSNQFMDLRIELAGFSRALFDCLKPTNSIWVQLCEFADAIKQGVTV